MANIGKTSVGTLTLATVADHKYATRFVAADTLTVYWLYGHFTSAFGAGEHARLGVYSDLVGAPNALLGYTAEITGTGATGWKRGTMVTGVAITVGTAYWLGMIDDAVEGINYDVVANISADNADVYAGGFANPFGAPAVNDYQLSIYGLGVARGDYCTVDEIKEVGEDVLKTARYDAGVSALIPRASRIIDDYMGREASAYDALGATSIRYFDGSGMPEQVIDECVGTVTVAYEEDSGVWTPWVATDFQRLGPDLTENTTPCARLRCDPYGDYAVFPEGQSNIRVTADWGYSADPPDEIKQAAIAQSLYMWKRAQQAYQDQGGLTQMGEVRYVRGICKDAVDILALLPRKVRF